MTKPPTGVLEFIQAHGGLERWRSADELSLRVSTGGFLFTIKGQARAVRDREAHVSTRLQRTVLVDYPGLGQRGVFERGSVRFESASGGAVASRANPRSAMRSLRRRLWWDKLDMLYFCGYALWTYMSLPFVLAAPGYEVQELESWNEGGETWRRVGVRFPAGIHTHCREQILYFDQKGLLRRHDYTPEAINGRAKAAHYCFDHRTFGGLIYPTRRLVHPRRASNHPLKRLTLVWINVEDVRLEAAPRGMPAPSQRG